MWITLPTSLNRLKNQKNSFPYGVMFHHFHGKAHIPDQQGSLSGKDLEVILSKVGLSKILTPREWLKRTKTRTLNCQDRCITFDDGLLSQFEIALPVLEKKGIKAFWFIYSAPMSGEIPFFEISRRFRTHHFTKIDDYYQAFFGRISAQEKVALQKPGFAKYSREFRQKYPFYSHNDICYRFLRDHVFSLKRYERLVLSLIYEKGLSVKKLSDKLWLTDKHLKYLYETGHVLGLHSWNHPTRIGTYSEKEQEKQYRLNFDHLTRIAQKPECVAHPCNSFNAATLKVLRKLNVTCGFRSNLHPANEYNNPSDSLLMAREDAVNLLSATGNVSCTLS